jgi:phage baseplate assembly protein W
MARNARTFSDLDLNFTPSPISLVVNTGNGLLTTTTTSDIIVGTNTAFSAADLLYRNIFVLGTFVGKVKETIDSTHLRLYHKANATFTTASSFTYSNPADLVKRYDENAIKASVRNLILTTNYERKFHPEIGSQVRGLMFEPATPMLGAVLERAIRQTIDNFEPRVTLDQVDCKINPDNNRVDVSIYFTILNTQTPQFLNLVLERTR